MIGKKPLTDLLNELGSSNPTPGGGSASALAAALSASLISMVVNLTVGRDKYRDVEAEMKDVGQEAAMLRQVALEIFDGDVAAYEGVMQAMRLPKGCAEEKKRRREAIDEALDEAARVPMELSRLAVRLLSLSLSVAKKGNPNTATDAGVAALMASAALQGAAMNVRINAVSLKDELRKERLPLKELEELEKQGEDLKKSALMAVARNIG